MKLKGKAKAGSKAEDKLVNALARAMTNSRWLVAVRLGERVCKQMPDAGWAWTFYGKALSMTGARASALKALHTALRRSPRRWRRNALTQLALHFQRFMEPSKARRVYRQTIKEFPRHAAPRIYLGAMESELGRLPEAKAMFRRATRCAEGCVEEALYNLAAQLAIEGRLTEALRMLVRALKIDPKYRCARKLLAEIDQLGRM